MSPENAKKNGVATPDPKVRSVSRFEAMLIRMLRSFMRSQTGEQSLAQQTLAAGKMTVPKGLSADCLHLVRETLAKGVVQYLARAGGWRRERFLRGGQRIEGRLWERMPPPDLAFSFTGHALKFLIWLTAGRPDKANLWDPPQDQLTVADQFLLFLAYEKLREHEAKQTFRAMSQFIRHGLVRLFFPEDFAGSTGGDIDCTTWTSGTGAWIMEAMQPQLQRRLMEVERAKNAVGDWAKLRGIGQSQDQVLSAFLTSCESAKRPDLARPVIKALAELLSNNLTLAFWTGGLSDNDAPTRLADRLDTKRQALAVLRHVDRLAGWARKYAGTSFFDEDYQIAQSWLVDWEQYRGEEIAVIAQQLLRQSEPLRMTSAPSANKENAASPTHAGNQ
jgi:FtsH ternary system-associated peptide